MTEPEQDQEPRQSKRRDIGSGKFLASFEKQSEPPIMEDMSEPASEQPLVYFVQIGKFIKIGFTTNLDRRISTFLNSAPDVEILLTIPSEKARDIERHLHNLLLELRVQSRAARELYHRDAKLLNFIHHYRSYGLQYAMDILEETTPEQRAIWQEEARRAHEESRRQTKAEKDAYFAGLVAERKKRLGW